MVQAQLKIVWPAHKTAVIVPTYDDALTSQLNIAIPQLDSTHLTGTFFLTGNLNNAAIKKCRIVGSKRYELANHTLYHPCLSTTVKSDQANASENYSVYAIIREISMMNNLLFALDGKTTRTYAYSCTETTVRGVSYIDSLRRSGLIKYARIGANADVIVTDLKNIDPFLVPSWGLPGNNTGTELIAFKKKVQKNRSIGIFMFHGVGGDYITTPAAAHKNLLKYLEKHPEIWVATFQQPMDYITQSNKQ